MSNNPKELTDDELLEELPADQEQELTSLREASRKMAALVTLDRAKGQPLFEQKMEDLLIHIRKDERVKDGALDSIPLLMENPDFVSEHHDAISRIFPDVWKEVHNPSMLESAGKGLLAEAGHKGLDKRKGVTELNQFVGMLDTYNKQFGSEGSTLAHLKSPEAKKWIKGGLKAASWGVSFVTGGIYVKAGIAATGYLIGKLGANEKVQELGRDLSDKAYASVSKLTGRSEDDLRTKAEATKEAVQKVTSKKWFMVAAAVAMAGVGLLVLGDLKTDISTAVADPLPDGNLATDVSDINATKDQKELANLAAETEKLRGLVDLVDGATTNGVDPVIGADGEPAINGVTADKLTPVQTVTVESGDSLWKIAEAHLEQSGGQASNKEISDLVDKIYVDNKGVIGGNRDYILPGQELKIDISPVPEPEVVAKTSPAFKPDIKIPVTDYGLTNTKGLINENALDAVKGVPAPTTSRFDFGLTSTPGLTEERRIDVILREGMNPKERVLDVSSIKYDRDDEPSIG